MREKFYEMLSSMSSHVINDDNFLVSRAFTMSGVNARVVVQPRERSNIYGERHIQYKRFDLSSLAPIALRSNGEAFAHDLVARLANVALFKYRLRDRTSSADVIPRFLFLTTNDINNKAIPSLLAQTTLITLDALEQSDFFIGQLSVMLSPSVGT